MLTTDALIRSAASAKLAGPGAAMASGRRDALAPDGGGTLGAEVTTGAENCPASRSPTKNVTVEASATVRIVKRRTFRL